MGVLLMYRGMPFPKIPHKIPLGPFFCTAQRDGTPLCWLDFSHVSNVLVLCDITKCCRSNIVLQALPPPAPASPSELASYGVAKAGLGVPSMSISAENKLLIAQVMITIASAD